MAGVSELMDWKAQGRAEGFAEGMAVGMLEARRSDLIKVLYVRFPEVPYEVTASVRGLSNLDQVTRWFEAALVAPTVQMFVSISHESDISATYR